MMVQSAEFIDWKHTVQYVYLILLRGWNCHEDFPDQQLKFFPLRLIQVLISTELKYILCFFSLHYYHNNNAYILHENLSGFLVFGSKSD